MAHRKVDNHDILPLVYSYFKSINLDNFAEKLSKMCGEDLENSKSPIAGKSLKKIIKFYVKNNAKVYELFEKHEIEEEEEEEDEEEEQKQIEKKNKKNKKVNKVESEDEEDIEQKPTKKVKQSKIQQSESEEEEVQVKQKKNKKVIQQIESEEEEEKVKPQKKKQVKIESEEEDDDTPIKITQNISNQVDTEKLYYQEVNGKKFFSKIDESRFHLLQNELKDNTFEAKFKYGQGGDQYGKEGYEKLKDKTGKDFRKEKNKLKNKAFCGGTIDPYVINSIKLC